MPLRETIVLGLLTLLIGAGAVAGILVDRLVGSQKPRATAAMTEVVPEDLGAEPPPLENVVLSDCTIPVPGEFEPNFVAWEIRPSQALFTFSAVWWDEGLTRTFNYADPRCLDNGTLWPYIEHAFGRVAEGTYAEDAGGGP